jgi:hypothetical protein
MKKRVIMLLAIALSATLPLAAKDKGPSASARIGAEVALENNFTRFGVGPWGDVNLSFGKNFDFEGYLGWTPFIQPMSVGSIFGEVDAYYHFFFKNKVSLHPALCVSDYAWLSPLANRVNVEPSLKLDINTFFIKLCAPLQVFPTFEPNVYIEPGIHLQNFTFKLRGAAQIQPFAFAYARWWADIAFGKNDLYAYGTYGVTKPNETVNTYNQYIGFYLGL